MAEAYDNNSPKSKKTGGTTPTAKSGPAKPAVSKASDPRMADIQRRAAAIANRKPVSPRQFFEEAWVELKKTTWPDRETLVKSTSVVLALVLAVAVWTGLVDFVFTKVGNAIFIK